MDFRKLENSIDKKRIILDSKTIKDYYLANTLNRDVSIPAVIQVLYKKELFSVLEFARENRCSVYPISTGHNWGYGCALPVADHCILLDLSGMNQILAFDERFGIITIEPGVTQKQLYEFLEIHDYAYLTPTTGAGPNCSLIGNILEHGIGLAPIADHADSVYAMEVIFGNGEVYSGCMPDTCTSLNKLYKWSVGPHLDFLFLQSNFGIVTQMSIRLFPKPQKIEVVTVLLRGNISESLCESLNQIQQEIGSQHMSNVSLMHLQRFLQFNQVTDEDFSFIDRRLLKTLHQYSWLVFFGIYGSPLMMKSLKAIIKQRFSALHLRTIIISMPRYLFWDHIGNICHYGNSVLLKNYFSFIQTALLAFSGIPTEQGLKLVYQDLNSLKSTTMLNPSLDQCGIIWFSPLVPLDAVHLNQFWELATAFLEQYERKPLISFTTISPYLFIASVPILYNKLDKKELKKAQECYKSLLAHSLESGFHPYRLGIQSMPDQLPQRNLSYWSLVSQLKQVFDPEHIISPGRYCPLPIL